VVLNAQLEWALGFLHPDLEICLFASPFSPWTLYCELFRQFAGLPWSVGLSHTTG
jgi:hypothetical protein